MQHTQNRNIQLLRGIAIIAVICIHNTPPRIWTSSYPALS